jgi:hypothetical protein
MKRSILTVPDQLVALLIAGDPDEANSNGLKLKLDGYTVLPTTGLERALDLAGESPPDLIFVCLGRWAVPVLVAMALRSTPATAGVPTVFITDLTPTEFTLEVGGLCANEQVIARSAAIGVGAL